MSRRRNLPALERRIPRHAGAHAQSPGPATTNLHRPEPGAVQPARVSCSARRTSRQKTGVRWRLGLPRWRSCAARWLRARSRRSRPRPAPSLAGPAAAPVAWPPSSAPSAAPLQHLQQSSQFRPPHLHLSDSGKSAVGEGALDLRQKPADQAAAPESSSRWWLWTGIGAVVAGGIVAAVLLSTRSPGRDGDCSPGLPCIVVGK